MKPIYALSIKQPWAWLICKGLKDIENRDWNLPERWAGVRIYVHAGNRFDSWALCDTKLCPWLSDSLIDETTEKYLDQLSREWKSGAIIGEVTITGCVTESKSPWFVGKYGFTLADPVLYDKPMPCRGQLGLFKPEVN